MLALVGSLLEQLVEQKVSEVNGRGRPQELAKLNTLLRYWAIQQLSAGPRPSVGMQEQCESWSCSLPGDATLRQVRP